MIKTIAFILMAFFGLLLNWTGIDNKFITVIITLVMVLAGFSLGIEIVTKQNEEDKK